MKHQSKCGLIILIISVAVIVLDMNCNAATISQRSSNDTQLDEEDYYSMEDDYDYKAIDQSPVVSNNTSQHNPQQSSTWTSSTTPSFVKTNLLSLDDDVTESQPCPLECNCHKEFVNCSGLQFSQLPQDLPLNMVGLDLSVNLLKEIDLNALIPFTQLRELNVSHNQIQDIQKLSEEGLKLPKLMSINLADNALSGVLDPESFAGLTGLRKLTLDNNSISLPENSLFNLPDLDELSLRNCGLDSLPSEMFSHLNTLKVLDMSDNPFKTELDINTFEPLTHINKLSIGLMEEGKVLELCTLLTTIDVINFPEFKISCYEFVNGYTFEQSMISNTPPPEVHEPYVPPVAEGDNSLTNVGLDSDKPEVNEPVQDITIDDSLEQDPMPRAVPSTIPETTKQPPHDLSTLEQQTGGTVNQEMMNQILLGIIVVAFIGLVIGVVCRRDYCGIKTKCCRTRRPPQTDQITPSPEEVPLNKITTLSTTNGANGTAVANGNSE